MENRCLVSGSPVRWRPLRRVAAHERIGPNLALPHSHHEFTIAQWTNRLTACTLVIPLALHGHLSARSRSGTACRSGCRCCLPSLDPPRLTSGKKRSMSVAAFSFFPLTPSYTRPDHLVGFPTICFQGCGHAYDTSLRSFLCRDSALRRLRNVLECRDFGRPRDSNSVQRVIRPRQSGKVVRQEGADN